MMEDSSRSKKLTAEDVQRIISSGSKPKKKRHPISPTIIGWSWKRVGVATACATTFVLVLKAAEIAAIKNSVQPISTVDAFKPAPKPVATLTIKPNGDGTFTATIHDAN